MSGYDFANSHLYLSTADGIVFDLDIRPSITIIHGDSGTGKTLLCSLISEAKRTPNGEALGIVGVNNVFIAEDKKAVQEAFTSENNLIIIDYADDILTTEDVEYINHDTLNHYLIFARRALGFTVTPNYVGEFIREGKTVRIKYMTDIQGWF